MPAIPESTCQAVRRAYEGVMGEYVRDDSIAFEAGVMVYCHLHPDTAEPTARDHVAQVIADSVGRAGLDWVSHRSP